MNMQELIIEVRAHALKNYEKDGWDFVVECWSDKEIEECILGVGFDDESEPILPVISTAARAIKAVRAACKMQADNRAEIMATAF